MNKVDRRRRYIMVIDTETANTIVRPNGSMDMSNVLVYDCGWQVIDKRGRVYAEASFVNRDIFVYERELMQSAYYANKIPQYVEDLRAGRRIMANTFEIREAMLADMEKFGISRVAAHNARFDITALNCTQRYVTLSTFRHWFPYGTEVWDTMKMAQSVILPMPSYKAFCHKYGFVTSKNVPRKTAEVLYRFISQNPDFEESHTGLEDVAIEAQILAYCFRQHKPMEKILFARKNIEPPTAFQKAFSANLREYPTIRMEV